jgi:leukotriene-A4 hydrolase
LIKTAKAFADAFISRNPPSDSKKTFDSWHTNTKLIFLNNLLDRINEVSDEVYNNLRDSLQLYTKQNAEVLNLWIQVALLRKRTDIIQYAQDFLSKNGRMKYIRPIYVAFYIFNKDEAKKTFNANKNIYHPIAVRLILQDFDKLGNNSINFLA